MLDYPTDIVNTTVRHAGDCVWIVDTVSFPEDPGNVLGIWEFHGRLGTDYRIVGGFTIPPSTGERTFILQIGDCVWISISDDQFRENPTANQSLLAQYFGRIGGDYAVEGYLVTMFRWVDPFLYGDQALIAPVRLLIETNPDTGELQLREDRQQGVVGPRCTSAEFFCPFPTVLHRVQSAPEPTPEATP